MKKFVLIQKNNEPDKTDKKSDWSKMKISKMKMIVVYQASFFFDSLK